MDYDADGDLDIVTGSYTGQLYLFRRRADGTFGQRELFVDEHGKTIVMPFDTVYSIVPELCDMDADGDLDLVIGSRSGPAQVVTNLGTRREPVWSAQHFDLETEKGTPIEGSNAHHADWDGDGVRDLVLGSEGGDVRWYRNVGENDAPRYLEGEVLVAAGRGPRQEEGSTPTHHGMRVKVHVTDWNGDGLADLLVGDVTWQESTPNPLNERERREKAELDAQYQQVWGELQRASGEAREALDKRWNDVRERLRPYQRTKLHTHGWVWLYLRRAAGGQHPR